MIGGDWGVGMRCHAMPCMQCYKDQEGIWGILMNHKNESQWFLSCNACDNSMHYPSTQLFMFQYSHHCMMLICHFTIKYNYIIKIKIKKLVGLLLWFVDQS